MGCLALGNTLLSQIASLLHLLLFQILRFRFMREDAPLHILFVEQFETPILRLPCPKENLLEGLLFGIRRQLLLLVLHRRKEPPAPLPDI